MSRKDYIKVAEMIRNIQAHAGAEWSELAPSDAVLLVVRGLADMFHADNPKTANSGAYGFDRAKFIKACGF